MAPPIKPDAKRHRLVIRVRAADLDRWKAAAEGSSLSAIARELLDLWAQFRLER
jgi:hypothetical protein